MLTLNDPTYSSCKCPECGQVDRFPFFRESDTGLYDSTPTVNGYKSLKCFDCCHYDYLASVAEGVVK